MGEKKKEKNVERRGLRKFMQERREGKDMSREMWNNGMDKESVKGMKKEGKERGRRIEYEEE